MLELTTGVVFLMSSLYGSGQADNHVQNMNMQNPAPVAAAATAEIGSVPSTNDPKSMEAYLRVQYTDTPILVDIARCESEFRQFDANGTIIRGIVNKSDVGVMQINEKYHADMAAKLGFDLHTVEGNVAYAKHLYKEQGSQPWSSSAKCWSQGDLAHK